MESRLSQLLQITHCLNSCNNNWTFLFLEQLAKELNQQSIGSLIACLLLNNQSILSNNHLQTLLKYSKNTYVNHVPATNNDVIPLISLPKDVFDHIGLFIGKIDGMKLGYCCHKLYHFTRTISFLHTSGRGHTTTLTCRMIQKIADTGYDPLIACINCHSLILCTGTLYINRFDISKLLNKIVNNSSYYSGWYKILFKNLNSIKIYENGAGLLSHLPMDILFGVEKLNKYTNEIEKINEKPLDITFGNVWKGNMFEFFVSYLEYFNKVCDTNLNKIRQIGWLSCESQSALINNDNKLASPTHFIHLLQPNYLGLRINGDIWLTSLELFGIMFHNKLEKLESQSCCFNFGIVMNEIYDIARKKGHVFNFQRLVMAHDQGINIDGIESKLDLGDVINDEDKQRLQSEDVRRLIERVDEMLAIDSQNTRMVFGQLLQGTFGDARVFTARVYCIAVQRWMINLINNGQLDVIKTQNQTSLKRVTFSENWNEIYGASTNMLQNFDAMFKYAVFYRILNWKNSVEYLGLSFFPKILNAKDLNFRDGYVNFGCVENFERALDNIFDENNFEKLKHVDIELHFVTKYDNIELEMINVGTDDKKDDYDCNYNYNYNVDRSSINISSDNNSNSNVRVTAVDYSGNNSVTNEKNAREIDTAGTQLQIPAQPQLGYEFEIKKANLFSKEDFEQTIDLYINVYTRKVITNISKQFEKLQKRGFKISLTITVGSQCMGDERSKIYWDNISKTDNNTANVKDNDYIAMNIDEWLTPEKHDKESEYVKNIFKEFCTHMKQVGYSAKGCLKEKCVVENGFVLSPCVLEIR